MTIRNGCRIQERRCTSGLRNYKGEAIVLNRKGEVVHNRAGSVTPEALEALYDMAVQ